MFEDTISRSMMIYMDLERRVMAAEVGKYYGLTLQTGRQQAVDSSQCCWSLMGRIEGLSCVSA